MGSFLRPTEFAGALAALAAAPRTILAGGTDHYPARVAHSPDEDILDITALPGLNRIETHADHWRIPCLATWRDLIEADLPPLFDGLRTAARQIGGAQIQNVATLCGNLCNASPAADGIPNLLVLDAMVELASLAGSRRVPVAAFVEGNRRTLRRPKEMVLGIIIPRPAAPAHTVFEKLGARCYLVISIVMVALAAEYRPDGHIARARAAVGACGPRAVRLAELETALVGERPHPDLLAPTHLAPLSPIDDIRGTAGYRRDAAAVLLRRALAALAVRAAR